MITSPVTDYMYIRTPLNVHLHLAVGLELRRTFKVDMARFLLATCVLAVCLAYTIAMGHGGDAAPGGGGGDCASSQSCPKPGGGCVELGGTFELNACTTLTCSVEGNVYGLRGPTKCAHGEDCFEGGAKKTFGNCGYTCSVSGTIGFTKDDPACE
ncbi:uncharacterized protein LOC124146178 isoform X2 [Haliotis rufescens]|uniref:uncharacterized protein LOC124146178 isoform X2 n=1 Tax=Haliotis rufescens TaxID=6454 RepID=UPI00201EC99E|nr:uncharacterized protein LOC124146178 isoform X2 [Haliotis rufescens]